MDLHQHVDLCRDSLLTLYHAIPTFNDPKEGGFGKHWEKKKMLVTFLLFPQCFVLCQREKSLVQQHLICGLQMLSIWS